jgi:membrane protein YdbS with pleckstrin-like domain
MSESNSQGSSLAGTVFIVFLILKLVGVIDWSWWWVTSPLWITIALFIVVLLIALLGASLIKLFRK